MSTVKHEWTIVEKDDWNGKIYRAECQTCPFISDYYTTSQEANNAANYHMKPVVANATSNPTVGSPDSNRQVSSVMPDPPPNPMDQIMAQLQTIQDNQAQMQSDINDIKAQTANP